MPNRPALIDWVDKQPEPGWPQMPLTHITRGIDAETIARNAHIYPAPCPVLKRDLAYFFYGRPAYRIKDAPVVKFEAACPFCFVFREDLIGRADVIHAFDTGAYAGRLYDHVLTGDMRVEDFSLGADRSRPNKLIAAIFEDMTSYFDGDRTKIISSAEATEPWDFHARQYIELLRSQGRNEPDDRICSIEVAIGEPVPLRGNILAVVVPHTFWDNTGSKAPFLEMLQKDGAKICPYQFMPGRPPEHHHALLEIAVKEFYRETGKL